MTFPDCLRPIDKKSSRAEGRASGYSFFATIAPLLFSGPLIVAVMTLFSVSLAQTNVPNTYAITGAQIITATGKVIAKGTVVIRDGLIAAVGESVEAPEDARIIDGTGLTVYPGLIDAYTSIGLDQPQAGPQQVRPGGPGQSVAAQQQQDPRPGLHPDLLAVTKLDSAPTRYENVRNTGITTALTIPRSGIFIGKSALINLTGDKPSKMVVKSPVALHIGFTSTGGFGNYPGSLMGVFAYIKQTLLTAQHYGLEWERYEKNRRGVKRPEPDEALEALQPVLKGELPVIILADTENEIRRAIKLGEEFKLKFILSGAREAYKIADLLKEKRAPVLVSLNYPTRPQNADPEANEPLRVLRQRAEAHKNAAALHKAGVKFAFTSGYLQNISDYIKNAARAIEGGLPKEEAIKALTINAAEIFGVADQLGSIEAGKIANLVITDGDIFDSKTKVKMVFIDGNRYEIKREPERRPGEVAAVIIAGEWSLELQSPQGLMNVAANFTQSGNDLAGTLNTPFGQVSVSSGTVSGKDIQFKVSVNAGGQPIEATFTGTVEDDRMTGSVNVAGQGSFGFTGMRRKGPGLR